MSTPHPSPHQSLTRFYILTSHFSSPSPSSVAPNTNSLTSPTLLPLLSTLPPQTQESIKRYYFHRDAQLSLGSALLKHYYVHRSARVPWSEANEGFIRRGDEKHGKPTWRGRVGMAREETDDPRKRQDVPILDLTQQLAAQDLAGAQKPHPSIEASSPGEVADPTPTQPEHQRDKGPSTSLSNYSTETEAEADHELEFNVSHQAGLIALIGLDRPIPISPLPHSPAHPQPSPQHSRPTPLPPAPPVESPQISLGVDITAPAEASRPQSRISTWNDFVAWVENFTDVFSGREIKEMKGLSSQESAAIQGKLRKFYTHWALKEAYIKMTGEALLAEWLKELEFRDVTAPATVGEGEWGPLIKSRPREGGGTEEFEVLFKGEKVTGVRMGVRCLGKEWVVATCIKGEGLEAQEEVWRELTIGDIEPCAKGTCKCLD